jgi:hypothetical protein
VTSADAAATLRRLNGEILLRVQDGHRAVEVWATRTDGHINYQAADEPEWERFKMSDVYKTGRVSAWTFTEIA